MSEMIFELLAEVAQAAYRAYRRPEALARLRDELGLHGADTLTGEIGGVPVHVRASASELTLLVATVGAPRSDGRDVRQVSAVLGITAPPEDHVTQSVVTVVDPSPSRLLELACLVAHLDPSRPLADAGSTFWIELTPANPVLQELVLGHRVSNPTRAKDSHQVWSEAIGAGSEVALQSARRQHGMGVRPALRARADAVLAAGAPVPTPLVEALAAHADDRDEARILDLLARADDDAIFAGLAVLRNFGGGLTQRRLPALALGWSRWVQDDVRTALDHVQRRVGPAELGTLTLPHAPGELTTAAEAGALTTATTPPERGER